MIVYPKFRADLEVSEQTEAPGHKIVVVKDPVSQRFFRLSGYEYRFLQNLDGSISLEQARDRLKSEGRYYSDEDVRELVSKAAQAGLILGTGLGTAKAQLDLNAAMISQRKARRLSSVYFLFVPLVNPDRFLGRTVKIFELFWNRFTGALALLAAPVAVYLVVAGIPKISLEYLYFFNFRNLFFLWVTVALTKLVHEMAHAYTAKRFGLHVPEMGLAFLIFFPCLYCNTTDAWQLADRKQRMQISASGIIAEASLAILAAYVWHFSKPGMVNSLAFYLMGVSLISTVAFNGNPLMKFDGYFLLIDLIRMPNLYRNSFAHVRYLFMNRTLGIEHVAPVARTRREFAIFTLYGVFSFFYRVFLYTGIVVGVYYRFDKTLGSLLAMLAFGLFIVRPMAKGTRSLMSRRKSVKPRLAGGMLLLAVVGGAVALLSVPVPRNSVYPCYLDSDRKQKLTVPLHTWIKDVYVREGQAVKEGTLLFDLDATALELSLSKKRTERDIVAAELNLMLLDETQRAEAPAKEIELFQAQAEVELIEERLIKAKQGFTAPFDGVVTRLDSRMKPGFQPGEGAVVGEMESPSLLRAHGLIPEEDLGNVAVGGSVRLLFPVGSGMEYQGKIEEVRPFSERDLSDSAFSSRFGGELATEVKSAEAKDAPLEAQYDCSISLDSKKARLPLGLTGRLAVPSAPKSIGATLMEKVFRTFNRETLL